MTTTRQPTRRLLPAALAVSAFGAMTAAALLFRTANEQRYLAEGSALMIVGAALLLLATLLIRPRPAMGEPTTAPINQPRRWWWLVATAGALCLAALAAINTTETSRLHDPGVSTHAQFALLLAGCLLTGYGLGGAPPLYGDRATIRRNQRSLLALGAILALALAVRLWGEGTLQRYLIDELHWSMGVMQIEDTPNQTLLTPMSGQSPYTWVFPYWQAGAVAVLGHNFVGLRFASVITGVLTVLAVYGLADALFDRKTALLAALVLATLPVHIHFSRVAMTLIADPLFGTLALALIARGLKHNRRADWAFGGVALGMTQYFYEGGRLLFPPLVVAFVLLLAWGGRMRGKWRGAALFAVAAALVSAPVYTTLISNGQALFGRYDDSGLGASHWRMVIEDGITLDEVRDEVAHTLSGLLIFGAQPESATYYGGEQALVNDFALPFFLMGCFILLWRYPTPAFIVPLWIAATVAGNGLLKDTLVAARYYVVLPALALAITAGARYGLAFLPGWGGDRSRRWVALVAAGIIGVIAAAQVSYYFGTHLPIFSVQVRDEKAYRDGIDAALRAAELPGNTQVFIIGKPAHDQVVPRSWLAFLARDGDALRYYPLRSIETGMISPKFLLDLPRGTNYAFFVAATDANTMQLIQRYFPAATARFSTADIPAHREYVLFFVPETSKFERRPIK